VTFWSDLIWVGNTLLPRGVVIGIAAAVVIAPFAIAGFIAVVRKLVKGMWS
jgi:hypothetical protein